MVAKRARSPSPSPSAPHPTTRTRTSAHHFASDAAQQSRSSSTRSVTEGQNHLIGDIFAYQELFLRILSFLPPTELARVQGVNKYWSRMSVDQQLWKRLYLSRYPHPHHSRLIYKDSHSGTSTPTKLRPIARLPSRAFPPPSPSRSPSTSSLAGDFRGTFVSKTDGKGIALALNRREEADEVGYGVRNDGVDWKMMLRLGTNWSNGNASSQATISLPPSPSPSTRSIGGREDSEATEASSQSPPYSEQHIALFPAFIFTSNPTSPLVAVHRSSSAEAASPLGIIPPPPGWSSPHRPDNVTAICGDQSVSQSENTDPHGNGQSLPARIAVFYQSGGFVVLVVKLDGDRLHWVRESIHPAQNRPKSIRRRSTHFAPLQGDSVVLATMHYPLLLTCTLSFHVSVYSIAISSGEGNQPRHLSTMHSDVSFHPAALSLFPALDDTEHKLSSFRAALTYCSPLYPSSWTIAVQEFGIDLQRFSGDVWRGECYNVGRGDEADEADEIWPRQVRPIVGVKGSRAVGVGTDGRWCVLAGEDNQIQVYSLPTPSPSPPPSRPSPILHAQTLLAHSSAVTSISLNAGRCVSGGRDGRVLVWELDEDLDDIANKTGRTVGYVEVRAGGRRWMPRSAPEANEEVEKSEPDFSISRETRNAFWEGLPHPASISHAARTLFLPRPPDVVDDRPPAIRQIAFDEERIVGLVRIPESEKGGSGGEMMKVWGFNG